MLLQKSVRVSIYLGLGERNLPSSRKKYRSGLADPWVVYKSVVRVWRYRFGTRRGEKSVLDPKSKTKGYRERETPSSPITDSCILCPDGPEVTYEETDDHVGKRVQEVTLSQRGRHLTPIIVGDEMFQLHTQSLQYKCLNESYEGLCVVLDSVLTNGFFYFYLGRGFGK